jgi:hypothetical protein
MSRWSSPEYPAEVGKESAKESAKASWHTEPGTPPVVRRSPDPSYQEGTSAAPGRDAAPSRDRY